MTKTTAKSAPELGACMTVFMRPRLREWEYRGTRAQIEAEGIIPTGTPWPEGSSTTQWVSGRLIYWLFRLGKSQGSDDDCWSLRCRFGDFMDKGRLIAAKQRDLQYEMFLKSEAGQRYRKNLIKSHSAARRDKAFQAFKALILPERMNTDQHPKIGKSAGTGGAA